MAIGILVPLACRTPWNQAAALLVGGTFMSAHAGMEEARRVAGATRVPSWRHDFGGLRSARFSPGDRSLWSVDGRVCAGIGLGRLDARLKCVFIAA